MRNRLIPLLTAAMLALSFVGINVLSAQGAETATISGTVNLPIDFGIDSSRASWVRAYEVTTANEHTTLVSAYSYYSGYIQSNRTYVIAGLDPVKQYIVVADSAQVHTTPLAGFMTGVYGGYASLSAMTSWDFDDPTIVPVTPTDKGVEGIDIFMEMAPTISGVITPVDATNKQVQACEVTTTAFGNSIGTCHDGTVNSDGSYSAPVAPGSTVVVRASADGYLVTSLGDYIAASSLSGAAADQMTQVPIPVDGSSVTGKDINLAQAASISGTVSLPKEYELASGYINVKQVLDGEDGPTLTSNTASFQINSDGSYKVSSLLPGGTYILFATSDSLQLSAGDASELLTTAYGGFKTIRSPETSDLGDPLLQTIVAQGDKTNIDITMAVGSKITGTVYLPDDGGPATNGYAICYEDGTLTNGIYVSLSDNGTYTCKVMPGLKYSVAVDKSGYAYSWMGGFAGQYPELPDPKVAVTPVLSSGETLSEQDITLHNGSSISGKLTYTADSESPRVVVMAYGLQADGNLDYSNYASTVDVDSDGNYTLTGVDPDTPYVVNGWATGYLRTWYGGFAGSDPSLPNNQVTPVLSGGDDQPVMGIDITLVKPATITGSVRPPSVFEGNYSAYIYACPTYTTDGQGYYRSTWAGALVGSSNSTLPVVVSTAPQNLPEICEDTSVDSDTGMYSVAVTPGVDYVLIGTSAGHENAWYGGYLGAAGIYSSNDTVDRPLPSTDITSVSGKAGQTVSNIDITFGESSVTFDADGGHPDTSEYIVSPDGTVAIPSVPMRTGYRFDGWYTQPDGKGTQFTADTVVDEDTTVYAKWTQVYKLIYDGNGTPGGVADPTAYAAGDKATVEGSLFTRDGYTFSGWSTAADDSDTVYTEGDQVTMTGDLTLYAQWTPNNTPTSAPTTSGNSTTPGSSATPSSSTTSGGSTEPSSSTTPGGSSSSTGMTSSAPVSPSVSVTLGNTTAPSGSSTSSSMTSSAPVSPSGSATTSKPVNPSGSVTTATSGGSSTSSGMTSSAPVSPSGSATTTKPVNPSGSVPTSKPVNPSGSVTTTVPVNTIGSATSNQPGTSNGQTSGGTTSPGQTTAASGGSVTTTIPGSPVESTQSAAPGGSVTTSAPAGTNSTASGQPSTSTTTTQPSSSTTSGQSTTPAPGQPSASSSPALPILPTLPGSTATPSGSSTPSSSAAPGTPGTSPTPGTPGSVATPGAPGTSTAPGAPGSSVTPGTTGTGSVSFNDNGGSGSVPNSGAHVIGETVTLPTSPSITREGYTFTGWNTAADGTGTAFAPGAQLTITGNGTTPGDLTLYAQWTKTTSQPTTSVNTNKAGAVSVPSGGTSQHHSVLALASMGLIAAGVLIRRVTTRF